MRAELDWDDLDRRRVAREEADVERAAAEQARQSSEEAARRQDEARVTAKVTALATEVLSPMLAQYASRSQTAGARWVAVANHATAEKRSVGLKRDSAAVVWEEYPRGGESFGGYPLLLVRWTEWDDEADYTVSHLFYVDISGGLWDGSPEDSQVYRAVLDPGGRAGYAPAGVCWVGSMPLDQWVRWLVMVLLDPRQHYRQRFPVRDPLIIEEHLDAVADLVREAAEWAYVHGEPLMVDQTST